MNNVPAIQKLESKINFLLSFLFKKLTPDILDIARVVSFPNPKFYSNRCQPLRRFK